MRHAIKTGRAVRLAGKLPMATREICSLIPERLWDRLTSSELALVIEVADRSYHNGRASTGAEVIDDSPTNGAVWINTLDAMIEWQGGSVRIVRRESE